MSNECTWCNCWICQGLPEPPPGFLYKQAGSDELIPDPKFDADDGDGRERA